MEESATLLGRRRSNLKKHVVNIEIATLPEFTLSDNMRFFATLRMTRREGVVRNDYKDFWDKLQMAFFIGRILLSIPDEAENFSLLEEND